MQITPRQLILSLITIVVLGLIGLGIDTYGQTLPASERTGAIQQSVVEPITYQGEDGKSALDLLKRKHTVQTVEYTSLGSLVTEIDGVATGTDAYWALYIDGQPATEGADRVMTQSGQTLEWRYEGL